MFIKKDYRQSFHFVFILIFSIIAIAYFLSCSIFRPAVEVTAYSKFVEPFDNIDTAPLEGKIIVIDPGHGGTASGAVGAGGLAEKSINLQVALRLQQYLEQAKAYGILTRNEDKTMIIEKKDSLRGDDLDYRVRLSNTKNADLFISLHHNSNLPLTRDYNAIETYYKMDDYFSSRDAARFIHKHNVKNLQIPLNFFKPGNYYVLRNNTQTAVLGEASYLSNPKLEKRLKTTEAINIEAKSYFLGILDYFSCGVPKIESIAPDLDSIMTNPQPIFKITIAHDRFGDGIDPHLILIGIDTDEIPYAFDASVITASPKNPLLNGKHRLFVNVANLKGNHSLLYEKSFIIDTPPAYITIFKKPENIPTDSKVPIQIKALVLDKNYNAVRDSTPVLLRINTIPVIQKKSYTKNGIAFFYFTYARETNLQIIINAGEISASSTLSLIPLTKATYVFNINSKNQLKQPLENVWMDLNNERFSYSDPNGICIFDNLEPGTYPFTARLTGYYPYIFQKTIASNESLVESITLEPLYSGVLFGKKIMIDPEFGGINSGALGPTGLRACDENMETALYLVQYLRMAGANVFLTISPGEDLTPYARVRSANEAGSELFITIRHGASTKSQNIGIAAYTYPTSAVGKKLSSIILSSFQEMFSVSGDGPIESAEYILQQTGCPAVIINAGNISNPVIEEDLYSTWRNRREAYAIFTAFIYYYSGNKQKWGALSGIITDKNGKAVSNALISLDKTIILSTGPDGKFTFTALEPRKYSITIQKDGYNTLNDTISIIQSQQIKKNYKLIK